jgi:predicted GNAT family N-acyltransferase
MIIDVLKITEESDLQKAWAIRKEVFVLEQACPEELEWEFEDESVHFLASIKGFPVGTSRWRQTDEGIKLERFAVLKNYRMKGVASVLLSRMLSDLIEKTQKIYLHAQLHAAPVYAKFGFEPVGENFWEAGIEHVKMVRKY